MEHTRGAARLLRRLREERGQSLRQTADDLGIAPSHLSRLERGEKAPSEDLQLRAARYYGVSEDLIALEDGHAPADIILILREHPEAIDELRRRYR